MRNLSDTAKETGMAHGTDSKTPGARGGLLPLVAMLLCGLSVLSLGPDAQAEIEIKEKTSKPRFDFKRIPEGTPIDVLATRIIYDSRRDVATAVGRVEITYGPYVLKARKVIYDRKNDQLYAQGHVRLREPGGNVLVADYVNVDKKFRDGFARHLRLLLTNDATLTARYARRRDGYITVYEDVRYTRCKACVLEDNTPLWELRSQQATHDEREGRIYHRNVSMAIAGTPIFWLPYLSHPDPKHKRATGFLVPGFGYSTQLGANVSIPYFINLAPNYDITLIPQIYSKQGVYARAKWRHRLASGMYKIDFGGIRQLQPKKVSDPGDRKWRGHVRTKGRFSLNRRWRWGFDGMLLSDKTVARRYGIDAENLAESRLFITGLDGRNYFSATISHFRGLLTDDDSETIPHLAPRYTFSHTLSQPILGGQLTFESDVYSIHRRKTVNPFTGIHQAEHQTRMITEAIWQRRMVSAAGIVAQPFARLRADTVITRLLPDPSQPDGMREAETAFRFLPSAGLDVRWPWLKTGDLGRHVVSPVFQVIAARNETDRSKIGNEDSVALNFSSTRLFLHDRFSGKDRYEGGVRANAGLLYSLYLNNGGFFRASVGQSYHLSGRNSFWRASGLGRKASDIVSAMAFTYPGLLRLSWQGRFDARSMNVRDQSVSGSLSLFGLTLRADYLRLSADPLQAIQQKEEQVNASATFHFGENWRIFGGWRYDLTFDRTLERSIGIGLSCDCMDFSLSFRNTRTRDADASSSYSVLLSVEFKTLVGGGISLGGF